MNFTSLCQVLQAELKAAGIINYSQESLWILQEVVGDNYLWHTYAEEEVKKVGKILKLRKKWPLALIIGHTMFFNCKIFVHQHLLLPRFDSECVAYEAAKLADSFLKPKIADMFCGTGCLGVSVFKNSLSRVDNVSFYDISSKALEMSLKNAHYNGVACSTHKVNLLSDNWQFDAKFAVVIANPPYIKTKEVKELKLTDPDLALDGGEDGLIFYHKIGQNAKNYLQENGFLVVEFGHDQKKAVCNIMSQNGLKLHSEIQDVEKRDRGCVYVLGSFNTDTE